MERNKLKYTRKYRGCIDSVIIYISIHVTMSLNITFQIRTLNSV